MSRVSNLVARLGDLTKRCFFSQLTPLVREGAKRPVSQAEFPDLPEWLVPQRVPEAYERLSNDGVLRFLWQLVWGTRPRFWVVAILIVLLWITGLATPYLIHELISQLTDSLRADDTLWQTMGIAVLFCTVCMLHSLVLQHYLSLVISFEQLVINAMNARVYLHALRLTKHDTSRRTIGDLVNHLGADSQQVAEFPITFAEVVYSAGITILVAIGAWKLLGEASFAAIAVLFALAPLCHFIGKRFVTAEDRIMELRDRRVTFMSQIISSIRTIKYLVWEQPAAKDIQKLREMELSARKSLIETKSASLLLFLSARMLSVTAALTAYVLSGNELDAATVFAAIALFDLWHHPFSNLSNYIADFAAAKVGAKRIMDFLSLKQIAEPLTSIDDETIPGLRLDGFSVRHTDESALVVNEISATVNPGQAVAIVGAVGSGKTTLLEGLLGEAITEGRVEWIGLGTNVKPKLAYVPQKPFIMNSSVKDNILFGRSDMPLAPILEATDFMKDVDQMPAGVFTEIGEQGINLSGGQKQRLALCRAAAADPTCVFLDDPVSAVDGQTEEKLMARLFFGRWRACTRIVVTHRLSHLDRFDEVWFVADGRLVSKGSFKTLVRSCKLFREFYQHHLLCDENEPSPVSPSQSCQAVPLPLTTASGVAGKLMVEEDREQGLIQFRVYLNYFRAMAGNSRRDRLRRLLLLISLMVVAGGLPILQNVWISLWANRGGEGSSVLGFLGGFVHDDPRLNLLVYACLALAAIGLGFIKTRYWLMRSLNAGKHLHDKALDRTLGAKVRFFDTNPVGRVLNRFGYDLDAVEAEIPWCLEQAIAAGFEALLLFLLVVILVPWSILAVIPGVLLFYRLQSMYRCTSREIKRVYSLTRSPRFAHFKETLEGLETIRAFGQQAWFLEKYYRTLEDNQKAFHLMIAVNRWFAVRLPILSAGFNLIAVLLATYLCRTGYIEASAAGLLFVSSAVFSDHLSWAIRAFSEAESKMTAVERLVHYQTLPQEPQRLCSGPPSLDCEFPRSGRIRFENVSLRYADELPNVLEGIDFDIPCGAKVGIIGKTGAGKSSLLQALFRLVPLSGGRILIDEVDTRTLDKEHLRRSLAIIPQDPVLYSGTLRSNLDRFGKYPHATLVRVMEQVGLKSFFASLPDGFDTVLLENGSNFSQGQKQLICLARALLSSARIVVMDEATASMDVVTDQLIQKALRDSFPDRTLLIIAHRLSTIAHCDIIIEMAQGRVHCLERRSAKFKESPRVKGRARIAVVGPSAEALIER